MLDKKDRKLISLLDMHGRIQASEAAKKTGISKQSVSYRIERLKERNLVNGYYTVINPHKLGLMFARFLITLKDTDLELENEIIDYGKKQSQISWIISTEGKWDMVFVLLCKDLYEIKNSVNDFIFKYGKYVAHYEVTIATSIYHFPHKYIQDSKETGTMLLAGKFENHSLDALDKNILMKLSNDARLSLTELARSLKTSYKVVGYRIKKLEDSGIILGYRASINTNVLGKTHYKVFLEMQNLTEAKLQELRNFMQNYSAIIYITEAIGFADIEFEAILDSHLQFNEMMKEIRGKFSEIIRDYEVLILSKIHSLTYLPKEI